MELRVEPGEGLADELPKLMVLGAPDEPVRITVETVDAAGHRWRSSTLAAEEDPSRPWWAMDFVSEGIAPVDFAPAPDRLEFRLRAETDGACAEATAVRVWRSGAPPEIVLGDGFRLDVFAPSSTAAPKRSVLMIPGSMGAASMLPRAGLLAARGHGVGLLSYVGEDGLPPVLREVALESLAAGYRAFAARPEGQGEIVVYTGSVGTGGALATLAAFPDLDPVGVVAVAPTHVIWQGLSESGPPPKASSWTLAGEPLPWVPMRGERILPEMLRHALTGRLRRRPVPRALHLRPAYQAGLRDLSAVEAARIEAEKIRCPLLLIAGEDDQMWPGAEMAREIVARRRRADDRLLCFEDAGHFIGAPFVPTTAPWTESLFAGGTAAGIARAQVESWRAILAFLEDGEDR